MRVDGAVVKDELDAGALVVAGLEHAGGDVAADAHQVVGLLRHVDVDRVELLHARERRGLVGGHQRAFREFGAGDAARDRGEYLRVLHVDLRGRHGGLGGLLVGDGGLERGLSGVVGLLRDGVDLHELGGALRVGAGLHEVGIGLGERGFCGLERGDVGGVVDLIELLAGLDFGAVLEELLDEDAVDLRANLGFIVGAGAARQGRLKRLVGRLGRHVGDFRRRHLPLGGLSLLGAVLAAGEHGRGSQGAHQRQGDGFVR